MNSHYHAVSAAREWGGLPEDYQPIEEFIDSSKQVIGDIRHRALYHHTLGVWLCQRVFGTTVTVPKKSGRGSHQVPVRLIAERHILEDLGWLPSPADYINGMPIQQWMSGAKRRTHAPSNPTPGGLAESANAALAGFTSLLKEIQR